MKHYTVALLLLGALACTDSNAPKVGSPPPAPPPVPPPPPPPPDTVHNGSSFDILPALGTAVVGELVTLVAQRADSTVDQWTTSDTNVVRLHTPYQNWIQVLALAAGTRAFIWENGIMRDLGVAPGHVTSAMAINDRGQVMGTVDGHTFLWENGQTQMIAPYGYYSFYPAGLGPNGEVIGWGMVGTKARALVWQAGRLIDLGPGVPLAINNRGEVVGWTDSRGEVESSTGSAFARPTFWRRRP